LDDKLVKHLGYLLLREFLIVFKDHVNVDNEKENLHFENITGTNWNSVRFKPPPNINSEIGWRVEFRVVEALLTIDENCAFLIILNLFFRMFYENGFKLNFYIPISLVHENF